MKTFYILLLIVFLASCSSQTVTETDLKNQAVQQTVEEIQQAVEELPEEIIAPIEEDTESEPSGDIMKIEVGKEEKIQISNQVVQLSTTYTNPKMQAVMNIEYTLNSDQKISSISVTSPNYSGMSKFNSGIQSVVGMTIEDASQYSVSGSSLASPAFQSALKNG